MEQTRDEYKRLFGLLLKFYRHKNELNQRDLGEALDVVSSTISRIESGKLMPDLMFAQKMAKYFNTSISTLLSQMQLIGNCVDFSEVQYVLRDFFSFDMVYLLEKDSVYQALHLILGKNWKISDRIMELDIPKYCRHELPAKIKTTVYEMENPKAEEKKANFIRINIFKKSFGFNCMTSPHHGLTSSYEVSNSEIRFGDFRKIILDQIKETEGGRR